MGKGRLEAFSDGVIAVIITIMVLELKPPDADDLSSLMKIWHHLLDYVLSFIVVAILWTNHHHLLSRVKHIHAGLLWANTNLLFWMSLIPFATAYMGQSRAAPLAVAVYGAVLALTAAAYTLLQHTIMRQNKHDIAVFSHQRRIHYKSAIGTALYAASVALAFASVYFSFGIFVLIPLLYFIPDRKLEELAGRD